MPASRLTVVAEVETADRRFLGAGPRPLPPFTAACSCRSRMAACWTTNGSSPRPAVIQLSLRGRGPDQCRRSPPRPIQSHRHTGFLPRERAQNRQTVPHSAFCTINSRSTCNTTLAQCRKFSLPYTFLIGYWDRDRSSGVWGLD